MDIASVVTCDAGAVLFPVRSQIGRTRALSGSFRDRLDGKPCEIKLTQKSVEETKKVSGTFFVFSGSAAGTEGCFQP